MSSAATSAGRASISTGGSDSVIAEFYRPSDPVDPLLAADLRRHLTSVALEHRILDDHAAVAGRDLLQTLERPGHVSDRLRQDRLLVAEVVLHDRVAGRQGSATVAEQ